VLDESDRFIREPEAKRIRGFSKSTQRRLEQAGLMPRREKIGPGISGWWLRQYLGALRRLPERLAQRGRGDPTAPALAALARKRQRDTADGVAAETPRRGRGRPAGSKDRRPRKRQSRVELPPAGSQE
jgi:predicted DNA-binding transcriptional regulator AlpA